MAPCDDLLALSEALDKLEQKNKRKADVVRLSFFAGLTNVQTADALGISPSTADDDWAYARCWLRTGDRGGRCWLTGTVYIFRFPLRDLRLDVALVIGRGNQ